MSSLEEIDALFAQAQEAIKDGKDEDLKIKLWPQIRSAVAGSADLTYDDRRRLIGLIYDRLDKLSLEPAGKATPSLSIHNLMRELQNPEERPPMWHPG